MKPPKPNERQTAARWLILLRPDGVVESVQGGAPVTWVGHALADAADVPRPIARAAIALLQEAPHEGYVQRQTLTWREVEREVDVELLLVEGLPLRRAHTRIPELIMRTLEVFATQAHSSDVDLNVEQAPNVPVVMVIDGEKVAWALATVVANALRFVERRDRKTGLPHIRVKVSWDTEFNELIIVVSDNGPGMSAHRARWLFDRDPATGKAAGLALLMVRDVMIAHRGSVDVVSEVGRGTTVTMRIPKPRDRAVTAPANDVNERDKTAY